MGGYRSLLRVGPSAKALPCPFIETLFPFAIWLWHALSTLLTMLSRLVLLAFNDNALLLGVSAPFTCDHSFCIEPVAA